MKKLFIILCIVLFSLPAFAADTDYFITPTGTGADPDCSGGGSPTCAGAWDRDDFNTEANWSATDDINKIDPGDTVFFTGDFSLSVANDDSKCHLPSTNEWYSRKVYNA